MEHKSMMNGELEISVVAPVYAARKIVPELLRRLKTVLDAMGKSYEIILVDDRSPQGDWEVIQQEAPNYPELRAFRLSRNFGQHRAITAGLAKSRGNWVVVMDCDLQDRPEEIPNLYEARGQADYVVARRMMRQHSAWKRFLSWSFYKTVSWLSDTPQDHQVGNFGIYSRKLIDSVLALPDSVRYFPLQVKWSGYSRQVLEIDHGKRAEGRSSYTFWKALNLAIDVMMSFSDKPLRLCIRAGFLVLSIGLGFALWLMIRTFNNGFIGEGWLSLMASLWGLSGLILILLGVIGLYVGKVFDQVKNRPWYFISEEIDPIHQS